MDLSQSFNIKLKNAGKQIFPYIMWFDSKQDHNSGMHAKNLKDISIRVRRLQGPFGGWGLSCGKGRNAL